MTAPRVSVVVVNYKGTDDTLTCLHAVDELVVPGGPVELIVVDNASGDEHLDRLRAEVPAGTVVVGSDVNGGFTGGCNLGASRATGEFLAFINNDARPDARLAGRGASPCCDADATIGVRRQQGARLGRRRHRLRRRRPDLVRHGLQARGGHALHAAHARRPTTSCSPRVRPWSCGPTLFRSLDGFDERYFMFYEDVDLGWRLNLLGHRVRYVPTSVVFHKHHASMTSYGAFREWFLLERNALLTLYKNLGDAPLAAAARARAGAVGAPLDRRRRHRPRLLDLQPVPPAPRRAEITVVTAEPGRPLRHRRAAWSSCPSLTASRRRIQAAPGAQRPAAAPLLRNAIEPAIPNERYLAGHQALVDAFGIVEAVRPRRPGPDRHRRPARRTHGGPGDPGLAHMADDLAREHEVRRRVHHVGRWTGR